MTSSSDSVRGFNRVCQTKNDLTLALFSQMGSRSNISNENVAWRQTVAAGELGEVKEKKSWRDGCEW